MGIALNDVFSTLGYYMGAAYVNDFVEFGRIYQVKIEARDQAQRVIDGLLHFRRSQITPVFQLKLQTTGCT